MILITSDFKAIEGDKITKLLLEEFEENLLIRAYVNEDSYTLGAFDTEESAKEEYDRIFFSLITCLLQTSLTDSEYHRKDICEHCGCRDSTVKFRKQNTAYVNEKMNWVTLCDECNEENEEYWAEMCREYYSSVL